MGERAARHSHAAGYYSIGNRRQNAISSRGGLTSEAHQPAPRRAALAWDGAELLGALQLAAGTLRARVDEVNSLNVFPVPDGDTGSNMLATVNAGIDEAMTVPRQERTVTRVAAAFGFGALMGARGNSGVILSQFFRGVADAVAGQPEIDGRDLAHAFGRACDAAYASVGRPVEGTMLTVAWDVSTVAREAVEHDAALASVLSAVVEAAAASVQRTPDLLPVLAEAGVVDAGGRGIELLLRGLLAHALGEPLPAVAGTNDDRHFPSLQLSEEGDQFGYETVFVIQPPPGRHLVLASIRDRLEQIGESVVVGGDERAVKVHVHSEHPDQVIALGLSLGTLTSISVENLNSQTGDVRQIGTTARPSSAEPGGRQRQPTSPSVRLGQAVVAVAPGEGFARIFRGLGVTTIVKGGPTANPSAGELADAIASAGTTDILILANNPNVLLAAEQAGNLCPGRRVSVVPTRNAAEGVAAMLAFKGDVDVATNAARMLKAAQALQTMLIASAVRDARLDGQTVERGEHMALSADERLLAVHRDRLAALVEGATGLQPGFELLTLYRGDGAEADDSEQLRELLAEHLPGVEIEIVDGGQEHYSYLISAE